MVTVKFISRWRKKSSGRNTSKENPMNPQLRYPEPDLLCLSHLRWNFVFQRPQHLMSRFARERRVFYWEEPLHDSHTPLLTTYTCPKTNVTVVTPHLPPSSDEVRNRVLEALMTDFVKANAIH